MIFNIFLYELVHSHFGFGDFLFVFVLRIKLLLKHLCFCKPVSGAFYLAGLAVNICVADGNVHQNNALDVQPLV